MRAVSVVMILIFLGASLVSFIVEDGLAIKINHSTSQHFVSNKLVGAMEPDSITWTFKIPYPKVVWHSDGSVTFQIPQYPNDARFGYPELPSRRWLIAIPPNARATDVEIIEDVALPLPGTYRVRVLTGAIRVLLPNGVEHRYTPVTIKGWYPDSPVHVDNYNVIWRHFRCVAVRVFPLQYNPTTGQVIWHKRITIRISYEPLYPLLPLVTIRTRWDDIAENLGLIANYEEAIANEWKAHIPVVPPEGIRYADGRRGWVLATTPGRPGVWITRSLAVNPNDDSDICIITWLSCVRRRALVDYINYRESQGWTVNVTTLESIDAVYAGSKPEKIRAFLQDAYSTWTRLTYVILAYDVRPDPEDAGTEWWIFYNGYYEDTDYEPWAPTDLPFADLSSSYNDADGDGKINGPGDPVPDYTPEVFVGRIPINNATQLEFYLDRVIAYEQETDRSRAVFAAQTLFTSNDGSSCAYFTYYDYVHQYFDESTPWVPSWDEAGCRRIYEDSAYGGNWTNEEPIYLINAWNDAGNHCITVWYAHGASSYIAGGFGVSHIPDLMTFGGLVWAMSCYTGSWHQREFVVDGYYGHRVNYGRDDSLAEGMIALVNPSSPLVGGAIGYVGASAPAYGVNSEWHDSEYNQSASAPTSINWNIDWMTVGWCALTVKLLFQVSYGWWYNPPIDHILSNGEAFWYSLYYFTDKSLGHSHFDPTNGYYRSEVNLMNFFGDPLTCITYIPPGHPPSCTIVTPTTGSIVGETDRIWVKVDDPEGADTVESVVITLSTRPPDQELLVYTATRYNTTHFYADVTYPHGNITAIAAAYDDTGRRGRDFSHYLRPLPIPYKNTFEEEPRIYYSCTCDNLVQANKIAYFSDSCDDMSSWEHTEHWIVDYSYYNSSPASFAVEHPYDNGWDIWLKSPAIDLSTAGTPVYLEFDTRYNTEYEYDQCYVEISTDGNNWIRLANYSGDSGGWLHKTYNISEYAGSTLYIRFHFVSDWSITDQGWWIDDIEVWGYDWSDTTWSYDANWTVDTNTYASPPGCFATWPQPYGNRWHIMLRSPAIDLTGATPPIYLHFWTKYSIEYDEESPELSDYGYVEISNDSRTWHRLDSITGSSTWWVWKRYDISEYVGQVIYIRFRFKSGYSVTWQGWWIDNINITNTEPATRVVQTLLKDSCDDLSLWDYNENWTVDTNVYRTAPGSFATWPQPYGDNWDIWIRRQITLPDIAYNQRIWIRFWTRFDVEPVYDDCSIEVSTDGVNWEIIDVFNGHVGSWKLKRYDITKYAGQTVYIRFHFESDYMNEEPYQGWWIDDVEILLVETVWVVRGNLTGWEAITGGDTYWHITVQDAWNSICSLWCGDEITLDYPDGLQDAIKAYFDLRWLSNATLRFNASWMLTSTNDVVTLEISTDGSTWTTLDTFTGDSGGWVWKQYDLSGYVGHVVCLCFNFTSSSSSPSSLSSASNIQSFSNVERKPGFFIDNFELTGVPGVPIPEFPNYVHTVALLLVMLVWPLLKKKQACRVT